jgi:thioredoxin-related protein
MKLKSFLLVFILSLNLNAAHQKGHTDIDISVIAQDAQKTNKTILAFFHMTHCPWCKKMLSKMYSHKDEMETINKDFYYLDINTDDTGTIIFKDFKGTPKEFAKYFNIKMYPTVLFIDKGEIVYYVHGYRNIDKFNWILKYVASKSIGKMDLLEFIDEEMMKED